ncbi:hypothetical protein MXD60_25775 [Frankia sp. AgB32]|nr:hypothetical protein [Frankia sp. AgB32]MCK9897955.1 hypothetical protein [Frankia sp. AgB32]
MPRRPGRGWDDEQWAAATARLVARGWLDADGAVTDAGTAACEKIEIETDERCAELWARIGATAACRLASLLTPITDAFTAAGTYRQLG